MNGAPRLRIRIPDNQNGGTIRKRVGLGGYVMRLT